jgi:Phage capsid family
VDVKELITELGVELDAIAVIRGKAEMAGRDLTADERSAEVRHHDKALGIRRQVNQIKADEHMRAEIAQIGADIGLVSSDPGAQLQGTYVPGTESKPYRASSFQPWSKSLAEAVAGDPGGAKAPPLQPDDLLPVALPAPRLISMGLPVMWTRDLLPNAEAQGGRYRYLRQSRRGWNARLTPPGTTKPVTDPGLVWIEGQIGIVPTLSEALNRFDLIDAPALREFVAGNLTDAVEFGIDDAIINGTVDPGIPGSWNGLMNDPNVRDLPYLVTDPLLDRIRRGINLIGRPPEWYPSTGILMSEDTWMRLELLKDDQGRYMLDGPVHDRASRRLWGVPVVVSPSMDVDRATAIVGDFASSIVLFVADRGSVHLSFSEHHADNFARNLVTFRAEARVGLALLSPRAFCRVYLEPPVVPPFEASMEKLNAEAEEEAKPPARKR